MRERRVPTTMLVVLVGVAANCGCVSRMIGEGVGLVAGASGKYVPLQAPPSLGRYRGLSIESLTVAPGLPARPGLPDLVRNEFEEAGARCGLTLSDKPCLVVVGEIIHYERAGTVDTAVGPLEEIIVRVQLRDGETKETLGVANLVGRAKATTAGGEDNLSKGAGKGLREWLEHGGLKADK